MTISVDWPTRVINVPQSYLTLVSGSLYTLDVDTFRRDLRDLEDNTDGMVFPRTHRHNTEVVLSGVTYARVVEIINNYTITFENGNYRVSLIGANNNIADVTNVNSVSIQVNNSAGLITVSTGTAVASDIYDYFTTSNRQDTFRADTTDLSTFDPDNDTVARVTLVDTTTSNTDMRGTDGANTTTPPTTAEINAEVSTALNTYDVPTKAELDAAQSAIETGITAIDTTADVTAIKERTDNLPDDPAKESSVQTSIAVSA